MTAGVGVPRGEARRGHAAMLLFSLLVSGSFSLGGLVANQVPPVALTAMRFLLATVVMAALASATGQFSRRAARAPWRHLLLGGLYVIYFVAMFEALKTARPVSLAAVFTLTPLLAAAVGWLWLRQVTTARMALALLTGATGAVWVVFRADLSALMAFRIGYGEGVFFIGCLAHATYPIAARRLAGGDPPLALLTGVLTCGTVLLAALGWRDIQATPWLSLGPLFWGTLVYLALVSGVMTFWLVQYAAMRLPGSKVMAYTYLTPAWVALWEVVLGHGAPPFAVALGVALTVLALVLLLEADPPPAAR